MSDSKIFAFLGVFLTVIGFLIVLLAKRNDKYAMFYAKQGLILFIVAVVISVISIVPIVGWIIYVVGSIGMLVLWIMALINSLSGKMKPTPLVGQFASKINL